MGKTIDQLPLDPHREYRGIYKTARGRLAAFLTDLDPLFRRLLTGDGLHAFDNIDFLAFDSRRRRQFALARRRYFTLLGQVVNEGPGREGEVNAEFLDNARREAIVYPKEQGSPGRPQKELGDHRSVEISLAADRLMHRFKPGFAEVQSLRRRGRYSSDSSQIRKQLAARYSPDEINAMIDSRVCRAAVARYLALPNVYNRPFDTIQADISRGRRLRRAARATRRPRI